MCIKNHRISKHRGFSLLLHYEYPEHVSLVFKIQKVTRPRHACLSKFEVQTNFYNINKFLQYIFLKKKGHKPGEQLYIYEINEYILVLAAASILLAHNK